MSAARVCLPLEERKPCQVQSIEQNCAELVRMRVLGVLCVDIIVTGSIATGSIGALSTGSIKGLLLGVLKEKALARVCRCAAHPERASHVNSSRQGLCLKVKIYFLAIANAECKRTCSDVIWGAHA